MKISMMMIKYKYTNKKELKIQDIKRYNTKANIVEDETFLFK